MLRKWTPGANDELIEGKGMINRGDRETTVHTGGQGSHRVPAGYGLIPTLSGPKVVKPGDWIRVYDDGITMDVLGPEEIERIGNDLLDLMDTEPETPEEMDAFLRAEGYDPTEIAIRGREIARRALEEVRANGE